MLFSLKVFIGFTDEYLTVIIDLEYNYNYKV